MPDHDGFIKVKNYIIMAIEPVHVGAGGYRLGRVDNTIIREPATGLPKLPGTSLAGVVRTYTAMAVDDENPGNMREYKFRRPVPRIGADEKEQKDDKGNLIFDYVSCTGKGGSEGEEHCGQPDCPICVPFGFSKKKSSFQGLVSFSDAHILLFPVNSMKGPVWISALQPLRQFMEDNDFEGVENPSVVLPPPEEMQGESTQIVTDLVGKGESMNLGWLLFENREKKQPVAFDNQSFKSVPSEILKRTVLVSDQIFSRLVNDNLEVRTSVAIDPATGAAEDGALYTYEALPRGTVLWFPARYLSPDKFQVEGRDIPLTSAKIQEKVEKGIGLMEILGVGGKGTRGMGRVRCLNMANGG